MKKRPEVILLNVIQMDWLVVGQTVDFGIMTGRKSEHRFEDIRLVFEGLPGHFKELAFHLSWR